MQDLYDYPVVIEVTVAWGEMDAFQHVNNAQFFRYFESARVQYFDNLKILDYMNNYARGPILASTNAKFLAPVKYPDTLSVGIRSVQLESGRITQEYAVWSHETSRLVAKGESLLVFFDYKAGRPCEIPPALAESILKLEPYLAEKASS
ncbi:acyl-CoA thioesterase [Thalassolituus pacificus]|uniref:Acyl-CoA thioesterase n=1 Tax=Thalassolituus pacificus TaxID=2975440 RepID=A0A9X3AIK4_9GAMM|nr:thioesterase family protein [Thalassolituus pacificus]MCT7360407.1 acyl-CoA thioesterase [Thalassolituus pacificus]